MSFINVSVHPEMNWHINEEKSSHFLIPTYLNFLIPQILKMCDPIPVTLMKMQPIMVNLGMKMQPHPEAHPH